IRWGFGPRAVGEDMEGRTEGSTLLVRREVSNDLSPPVSRHTDDRGSHFQAVHVDNVGEAATVIDPAPPHLVSIATTEISGILGPSLPVRASDRVFGPSSGFRSFGASQVLRYPSPSQPYSMKLSHTDSAQPDLLFSSLRNELEKLKSCTPESLPPYNARLRTKSHAQVLKHRLLPIGRFIVEYLDQTPEESRGRLELEFCRYIATQYWPLPVNQFTHIKIHEMYRNALF
ncbi:hypothetical protein BDW02DRAFT_473704, partial [Decorospora gaudefroyi]